MFHNTGLDCIILLGDTSDSICPEAKLFSDFRIFPKWNLQEAHKKGINGEGITIAVLDSGVNVNHDDFTEKHIHLSGKNFINNGNGDDYWRTNREAHGTMVTGIVAQYAPKAEIYVCCVSERVSEEKKYYSDAIIGALEHLKKSYEDEHLSDKKKCQVIVMSFGHYKEKENPKREELINDLASKGVICVAAIGNYGLFAPDVAHPARLDQVIAVGGLSLKKCDEYDKCESDECDHKSVESDLNPPGKIDVFAPGENVYAPVDNDNSKYQKVNGTSYAAPAIGGIVALLMQLARDGGVEISKVDVQLIKKILSHMKREVTISTLQGKKKKMVYNPKKFFSELYETPDTFETFKALVESI